MTLLIAWTIFLILVGLAHGADRCQQYIHDVRVQHTKYFGLDYPYWYGVGQLRQESGCRSDLTAFDGGQGIAQFMPRTETECEKYLGPLNMYRVSHALKAQAWYMSQLHKQSFARDTPLWLDYQAYNGGWKPLKSEFARAGSLGWAAMYEVCDRRILKLKSGKLLSLCDVNYDYSQKIYRYGNQYKTFSDKRRFW